MSIALKNLEKLFVEVFFRHGVGKRPVGDVVKEGEVGRRILFGSCLSGISQKCFSMESRQLL